MQQAQLCHNLQSFYATQAEAAKVSALQTPAKTHSNWKSQVFTDKPDSPVWILRSKYLKQIPL